jgi:threonine dehydrogenase-like Zn-dependent dehydrogenase
VIGSDRVPEPLDMAERHGVDVIDARGHDEWPSW